MRLGYEFSAIDIGLLNHPKAILAGPEAMGLWLWGQMYAKFSKSGGHVHRVSALSAWGGKRNIMLAKRLVEAGLWIARDDGDWDIHNFDRKAPASRARGIETPGSSTPRVRALRQRKQAEIAADEMDVTADVTAVTETVSEICNGNGSYSYSPSLSVSSLGESPREGDAPASQVVVPDPASAEPDWWAGVIATISTGTGIDLPLRESWLRYAGHRASKARPAERRDAVHWLTTVMVKEAREDRSKAAHQRERDALFDQRRAGPAAPSDTQKLTTTEQASLAERFPMVRRQRGAA